MRYSDKKQLVLRDITLEPQKKVRIPAANLFVREYSNNFTVICKKDLKPNTTTNKPYKIFRNTLLTVSFVGKRNVFYIGNPTKTPITAKMVIIDYFMRPIYNVSKLHINTHEE